MFGVVSVVLLELTLLFGSFRVEKNSCLQWHVKISLLLFARWIQRLLLLLLQSCVMYI